MIANAFINQRRLFKYLTGFLLTVFIIGAIHNSDFMQTGALNLFGVSFYFYIAINCYVMTLFFIGRVGRFELTISVIYSAFVLPLVLALYFDAGGKVGHNMAMGIINLLQVLKHFNYSDQSIAAIASFLATPFLGFVLISTKQPAYKFAQWIRSIVVSMYYIWTGDKVNRTKKQIRTSRVKTEDSYDSEISQLITGMGYQCVETDHKERQQDTYGVRPSEHHIQLEKPISDSKKKMTEGKIKKNLNEAYGINSMVFIKDNHIKVFI